MGWLWKFVVVMNMCVCLCVYVCVCVCVCVCCVCVCVQELEAIGIKDKGIAQHLEKAAKKLPMFVLEKGIPVSVNWQTCTINKQTIGIYTKAHISTQKKRACYYVQLAKTCRRSA